MKKSRLTEYAWLEAPLVTSYIHMGNKAVVLIGLNQANPDFIDAGRDVYHAGCSDEAAGS